MDDLKLLEQYVRHQSEDAFATLVSRHLNLVYSTALRRVSNPHQAQEITQAVFIMLARKAARLGANTILSGWLYRATCLASNHSIRAEVRRVRREQEAYMQSIQNEPEPDLWEQIAPRLEDAIESLREKERNAVVLRFFQCKSLKEVGAALGTNEDAAQKTVGRAVEKLRVFFLKRGIAVSERGLAGAMAAHSVAAAPIHFAQTILQAVTSNPIDASSALTLAKETLNSMFWNKIKSVLVGTAAVAMLAGVSYTGLSSQIADPSQPPPLGREFRGVWVATVANIDWPSAKGLAPEKQKAELETILDRMVALNCNALVLQVRPMCDALYPSQIEPWSEYLTGQMGTSPGYDPLEFAVAEAHKRGIELHAWFNPFRAGLKGNQAQTAPNHVSRTHPELIRPWGNYLWLDPTEPASHAYSLSVIQDVVRRYDIDAVHFDDYFYPYRDSETGEFPDDSAWQRYRSGGGTLSRNEWRRSRVNDFIQSVQKSVRAEKSWVKFGVSPFGIWQPDHPAGIRGINAYDMLFADARKWLAEGWVDYLAPQLYWPMDSPGQSFPALLKWWNQQNSKKRHLWPGLSVSNKPDSPGQEIAGELAATRKTTASGALLWHAKTLFESKDLTNTLLKSFSVPALVPASPWLDATVPSTPTLRTKSFPAGLELSWEGDPATSLWVLQTKEGRHWKSTIIAGPKRSHTLQPQGSSPLPTMVALTAVNRFGNASSPTVLSLK